jgi:TonB family protein
MSGANAAMQIAPSLEHLEPWTTTFKAQLKRNWFVPVKDMASKGRVTIGMVIWRDGRITDVTVVEASPVDSFNRSALHAVVASSPTNPLPAAYTQEKTPLTITFYFNESRSPT